MSYFGDFPENPRRMIILAIIRVMDTILFLSPMMNVYSSLSTAGICVLRAVVHISAESL
jgi:hypothetical protein